ncbi:class I SAM-dependent methyltransferase [Synechocystis sp. PCC 7339]|nr:class I SAM-dependent methyltransferase [Synechocystis sp. PCC 7339]
METSADKFAKLLAKSTKKKVLHVGCGPYNPNALPPDLRTENWQEIRLDIDPKMQPDILGTITDLSAVPDNSVDAVYSSHNLEHIYDYEVPLALAEFKRVLKPGGLTWLVVPDMQLAAEWVVKGDMDDQPLYTSPAGPVRALWMFYGMGTSIPGTPYMAHKTGFTASGLRGRLTVAGFRSVEVWRGNFNIYAKGYKKI